MDDDDFGGTPDGLEKWFSRSPADIDQERRDAEQAGRDAYAEAIRTGANVQARTPAELLELGRSRLAQQAPQTARNDSVSPPDCGGIRAPLMQGDAFVRGVANVATFGLADPFAAGMETLIGHGGPGDWDHRFQQNLQLQKARDAYDAQHRALAQGSGEVAGAGLSYLGGAELGSGWASGLSPAMKGNVGEGLSMLKTFTRADVPIDVQVKKKVAGGFTRADHTTWRGQIVESKFGPAARLSPRQGQAQQEYHPNYRVDWWGPDDVGVAAGGAAAGFGLGSSDPNR